MCVWGGGGGGVGGREILNDSMQSCFSGTITSLWRSHANHKEKKTQLQPVTTKKKVLDL